MTTTEYFKHMYGGLRTLEARDMRNVLGKKNKKKTMGAKYDKKQK